MKKYNFLNRMVICILLLHCLITPLIIFNIKNANLFVKIYSIVIFISCIYYLAENKK